MDRDEAADEIDRSLARLGAATEGLAPDPRITGAVIDAARELQPATDPLARIARVTSSLDPGDAIVEEIVARAERLEADAQGAAPSWLDGVVRGGPVAVGLAALAAAASFLLFLASQGDVDAALASSVDTVEVSE